MAVVRPDGCLSVDWTEVSSSECSAGPLADIPSNVPRVLSRLTTARDVYGGRLASVSGVGTHGTRWSGVCAPGEIMTLWLGDVGDGRYGWMMWLVWLYGLSCPVIVLADGSVGYGL